MPTRLVRTARQAIDILGGVVVVSELCGVGRNAVTNWYKRGLPPEAYHALAPRLVDAHCRFSPKLFKQYRPKKNGGAEK